jgi:hypothetical protein
MHRKQWANYTCVLTRSNKLEQKSMVLYLDSALKLLYRVETKAKVQSRECRCRESARQFFSFRGLRARGRIEKHFPLSTTPHDRAVI